MRRSVFSFTRRVLLPGLCALCAGAALAQVPPMRGEGPVRHVCGGIGSDESTAMRAAMKDHPLSLMFSRPDGDYLADVQVEIQGEGQSLALRADGPICLIDLPPGKYTVQVTRAGVAKREMVTVARGAKTLDFRF